MKFPKFLFTIRHVAIISCMMSLCFNCMASQVIVLPGGVAAGYIQPSNTSVNNTTTIITNNVPSGTLSTTSGNMPISKFVNDTHLVAASLMTVENAGTCTKSLNIGDSCAWSDGVSFQFGGISSDGYYVFAENTSVQQSYFYSTKDIAFSQNVNSIISSSDGFKNQNNILMLDALKIFTASQVCSTRKMFIPALNQMFILVTNKNSLNFTGVLPVNSVSQGLGNFFLTSTQSNNSTLYIINLDNGMITDGNKGASENVKCIRAYK